MTYRCLINGSLVAGSSGTFTKLNPATASILSEVPAVSKEQTDEAISAAVKAQKVWCRVPESEKKKAFEKCVSILESNKDSLAELLTKEQGKPLASAHGEANMAINAFKEAARVNAFPERIAKVEDKFVVKIIRKPIGVVAGICPWNFPLGIAGNKIAKALAFGNAIILKPSPFTPLTGLKLGELLGCVFPPGLINVLTASDDPSLSFNVGAYIVSHPSIQKVAFTGSVPTGKAIQKACAGDLTRTTLELGGNDAAIVREDVDIPSTSKGVLEASMANTGQICCAVKRVYVHESIYDKFVEAMTKHAQAKIDNGEIGDGLKQGVTMGPINNKMQFDRVMGIIEDAKKNGAKIACGGGRPAGANKDGYFIEPTVVANVSEGHRIVDEEQFGPVVPVMKYSTDQEAVERANNSDYGLAGSVWTSDEAKANELAVQLDAGTVWVNQHLGSTGNSPFGGFKLSGIGREGDWGEQDMNGYTECMTVKMARTADMEDDVRKFEKSSM